MFFWPLQDLLLADGILEAQEDGSVKFMKEKFDETWMKYCLVWHIPGHPVRCSCWAMSWHSHCVHQHIAEEWWGLETWTEGLVPRNPRRGAATRSPSEEATNPRARKKAAR